MTEAEKLKELEVALQWVVSEMSFIGYGSSKSIREAKDVLKRIRQQQTNKSI